jgi:hypothetical protein
MNQSLKRRGRRTILNRGLQKRICALLAKGLDQKSACNLAKIPYSTYNEWKARGQNGEEPSPREELQTPIGITMRCTLPSGNTATVDEMMEVARQWHEKVEPSTERATRKPA